MRLLEHARRADLLPPAVSDAEVRRLYQVFKNNAGAVQRYVPGPYDGKVILFESAERLMSGVQVAPRGWDEVVTGELQVFEAPGDHYSMMREPHVVELASLLRACLGQSRSEFEEKYSDKEEQTMRVVPGRSTGEVLPTPFPEESPGHF
jgi:thioesterase domain-containing protein